MGLPFTGAPLLSAKPRRFFCELRGAGTPRASAPPRPIPSPPKLANVPPQAYTSPPLFFFGTWLGREFAHEPPRSPPCMRVKCHEPAILDPSGRGSSQVDCATVKSDLLSCTPPQEGSLSFCALSPLPVEVSKKARKEPATPQLPPLLVHRSLE